MYQELMNLAGSLLITALILVYIQYKVGFPKIQEIKFRELENETRIMQEIAESMEIAERLITESLRNFENVKRQETNRKRLERIQKNQIDKAIFAELSSEYADYLNRRNMQ